MSYDVKGLRVTHGSAAYHLLHLAKAGAHKREMYRNVNRASEVLKGAMEAGLVEVRLVLTPKGAELLDEAETRAAVRKRK